MSNLPIHAIIFDLVGVLFRVDKQLGIRQLGIKPLLLYCLRNYSSPFDQGMAILNKMRLDVQGEFQDKFTYKGVLMPQAIGLWQRGHISSEEALSRILIFVDHIDSEEKYFAHKADKEVIVGMLNLMLNTDHAHAVLQPIASSLKLIADLKETYPIYLLSNINADIIEALIARYPDFFGSFNGITASYKIHLLKPEPEIFTHTLTQNNLNAQTTCFIDDQLENIEAAQKLGLQTIHCTSPKNLPTELKKLGVTLSNGK